MQTNMNFFAQSENDVITHFNVTPQQGLTSEEVHTRREQFGLNSLGENKTKSSFEILIDQIKNLLTGLLFGAAVLSFAFDDIAEGIAILVVILINVAIGYSAERKALQSMASLREMGRATTRVRRNGKIVTISDEGIVPGDIILLDAGDIVTADIRLLDSVKLQCNESLLTGEPIPTDKTPGILNDDTLLHDRKNILYKGTSVTRGSCMGITVATGRNTELGKISSLAHSATGASSPLEKRLQKLSEHLLLAVIILTVLMTIAGIISGRDTLLMVKTGIALAVAAIPEGLPIVATLALARGMWKLAKHNALIERLSAVETLGSVNVIFTDKTGTLTENQMTVTTLIIPAAPHDNHLNAPGVIDNKALRVCSLCYSGQNPDHLSDPMEVALISAASQAGLPPLEGEKKFPRCSEEPFDPHIRMMATIHQSISHQSDDKKTEGDFLYLIKGAPEAVISKATSYETGEGKKSPLTPELKEFWLTRTSELAEDGLRVLAVAEKSNDKADLPPFEDLTFLGLICLSDPPRSDAAPAVQAAQEAGIRVIMVTGDNAITGASIAEAVGIADASPDKVVTGDMMASAEEITPAQRDKLLSTAVFARMAPEQKLTLIDLHQKNGAVVAMTGDGVNDAPALKKADVGIAMGLRGTEVAKEAAEMILRDDAFSSIVIAIQQGRVIFANIRKFVIYLLSCNLSEVLVVTFCMLAGLPLPLLPLQILFLNLVTDVFPALALGFGKGDQEILHRPPHLKSEGLLRNRHWQAIISYSALMTITVIGAFVWALSRPDQTADYANSIAFLTLALGQLWHVFNMRSRKAAFLKNQIVQNPYIWGAIGICLILIFTATYFTLLGEVLHITPPDKLGWMVIFCASLLPLIIGQVLKLMATYYFNRTSA